MCFRFYGNLVNIDLQWEKWKLAFIATSLQTFWQKFYRITEMFLESSATKHMNFVQTTEFDWLPWQRKC